MHIKNNKETIGKFIFSGGTASLTSLAILFLLTHFLGFWYLVSSVVAFFVSTTLNFILQKYFTFRDFSQEDTVRKAWFFFLNGILDMSLNAVSMYLLVDGLGVWYMLAQCIVIGTLAVKNYLVFKMYIFKK